MEDDALLAGEAVAASPFEGPSTDFFNGAHRGRQLEELRHLSRWSRRLLAVTGDRGVGKSSLYRALSARLDPGVKAARINANLTSDTREVLHALLQGFGVASPANANAQLLAQLITVHVEEQVEARRHCLVLVDDAHLLDLRALEQLLHLIDATSDDALRIVFFAEAYFIAALDKATKRLSNVRAWHEIRLMPFTDDETREYVAFRLQQAGVRGRTPFSSAHLKLITDQADGLPGRINEIATAILNGEIGIREQGRWLPSMHRAIALLLTAVVAGVWLAWSSYQRLDAPAALVPKSIPHTGTLALPGEQAGEQPGEQESDAADAGGDKVAEQQIEDHEPTLAPPTASATPPSTPLDPPSPQAVDLAADTPDPMAAAPGAPAPVLAKRPEPVAKTAAKPSPAAATAVSAAPAPAATPAAPVKEGPHGAAWVLAQPEGNYTLQLFGTSNKARWQSFVQAQRPGAPVAGFVSRRDGAPWYVVIYGSYPTQAMAKADVTRLPASVGNVEPWLRTFRAIRATVVVEGSAAP